MKNPNPSETTSTGIPAAWARRTNGTKPGSCGWAAAVASSVGRVRVDHRHLEVHQPARAHQAGVVGGGLGLPDARHVLGHDRVGHVGQGDRPVVVDEDRQRRRAGDAAAERAARRRPGSITARAGADAPATARRPLGHEPRRRSATPARMIAPPTTWTGRIGSPRKTAAMTTASAGTRNCSAVTRVGPRSFTPWKTTTFANPAASVPE